MRSWRTLLTLFVLIALVRMNSPAIRPGEELRMGLIKSVYFSKYFGPGSGKYAPPASLRPQRAEVWHNMQSVAMVEK